MYNLTGYVKLSRLSEMEEVMWNLGGKKKLAGVPTGM